MSISLVTIASVTPSPYQRDLFLALHRALDGNLEVFYFEEVPDDSPWTVGPLNSWETILPGRVLGKGRVRCHVNSDLPSLEKTAVGIVNAPVTALTTRRFIQRFRRGSIPWVFWGEYLLPRTGIRGWLQRSLTAILETSTLIVAIGERAREDYQSRFSENKIANLPYSTDLRAFSEASKKRTDSVRCRFLFAGQMIERKGVDILLAAFSRLCDEGLPVELILVGRTGDYELFSAELASAVKSQISFLGFMQPDELPTVFAQAEVFVLPSRHDGWGVVVNQAFGARMPVITTDATGAGLEFLKDGRAGFLVEAGSEEELYGAMRKMVEDSSGRERMAEEAAQIAEKLTPEVMGMRWKELMGEVLK